MMHYAYDMLGARILQDSTDAGPRWIFDDTAGKPIRGWDSRGAGDPERITMPIAAQSVR